MMICLTIASAAHHGTDNERPLARSRRARAD